MNASSPVSSLKRVPLGSSETQHAVDRYLPLRKVDRKGIAVCLSGGGYRAALFHLGGLRRLNELGILSSVNTISSVSGGSIASAFLAAHLLERFGEWPQPGEVVPGWETGVAEPLRELMRTNIRTGAALTRIRPDHLFEPNASSDDLAGHFTSLATSKPFSQLTDRPRFIFCATNLRFRSQWTFDSGANRIGDAQIRYLSPIPADWTVATAAAASSCFPIVFAPRQFACDPDAFTGGAYQEDDRTELLERIDLSDGGVYDNLALEPVWRTSSTILISDAGPTFRAEPRLGPSWLALRYLVTFIEQEAEVRKRWFLSNVMAKELNGTYWGMASLPTHYELEPQVPLYPDELISKTISQFRIDLDACTDIEMGVLENHGYALADLAIRKHLKELIKRPNAPGQVPFPEYMDPRVVRQGLAESDKTSVLGHGHWW
jgi:NTE family protein